MLPRCSVAAHARGHPFLRYTLPGNRPPCPKPGIILFRALGIDYIEGSGSDLFAYDITMWGPILGVSIKW